MANISFESVSKTYPDGTQAVEDVDLEVADGEFVVLVGPSGCGKTTLLRMVAGLEDITGGKISIGGEVVNDVASRDRDVAMVFQSYALYPHMTVERNIAFGLELQGMDKEERNRRARSAAEKLGIEEFLDRRPKALSGGQRQRVAMGRAIVREPNVFLMDEPLSNLDAKLRVQMRSEISQLQRDLGVTTLYVTHDQTEAMTMGDRVAVLRGGILQQVDTPQVLYDDPVNLFVAGFIGSPAMNLAEAELTEEGGQIWATFGSHRLPLPEALLERRPAARDHVGQNVILGMRPEHMEDAEHVSEVDEDRVIEAQVNLAEAMGSDIYLHVQVDAPFVFTDETRELIEDMGEEGQAWEERAKDDEQEFVARVTPRSRAKRGDTVRLHVDCDWLYLFDPSTGEAIRGGDGR